MGLVGSESKQKLLQRAYVSMQQTAPRVSVISSLNYFQKFGQVAINWEILSCLQENSQAEAFHEQFKVMLIEELNKIKPAGR